MALNEEVDVDDVIVCSCKISHWSGCVSEGYKMYTGVS